MKTYKVFMEESATLTGAAGGATFGAGVGAGIGTAIGGSVGAIIGATAGAVVDTGKYVYKKNKEQRAKYNANKETEKKNKSNAAGNDHTTPKDNKDPSRAPYDHDKYKERKKDGEFIH